MNPLTKVRLINELNEREASLGIKDSVSWHAQYKNSAWVFIGGFPYELTEGDIICVFSQYGEIANINLVRDKKTGKSKGFCFLCYEDQRSTILAVDNFNGIKIKGRTLRVDHVENYRPPKDSEDIDDVTKQLREAGCAPRLQSSAESESEAECLVPMKKSKKDKKEKKKKKKEKKEKKKKAAEAERRDTHGDSSSSPVRVKKEREDVGYEKYVLKEEPRAERVGQETRNQRDRTDDMDRFKNMHENSRRVDRVRDREEGGAKDDLLPRQSRDRYREGEREREKDKDRAREHERERDRNRDRDNEREKERSRDKARDSERERDKDRQRERDGEREGKHREKDKARDQEREADRGHSKHSRDRGDRRN